jgi:drug/metabolite transporter (DMT)-like permease
VNPILVGTACGIGAALLFGLSPPLVKLLLPGNAPAMLAGLLYLGAGLGLLAVRLISRWSGIGHTRREAPLRRSDLAPLLGVIVTGGMVGPLLMLVGLGRVSGSVGSLLLNLEAPFTIALAVIFFREHLDVYALRLLGAAREAALFASAPFVGALASMIILGERLSVREVGALLVMALGVGLLVRARHAHLHTHEPLEHDHLHAHDEHHQHEHSPGLDTSEPHSHPHRHAPLTHDHPHVSDLHHRHRH